ncbi:MAG: hydantoinase/oxoprolinase family protein [Acidimicrobiia bacterium]|nr:hydantoinase/oxoprolinase family protein [Acidimicrobiia bacterium]
MRIVAIDSGGTFTDVVAFGDGSFHATKVPSTPHDPALATVEAYLTATRGGPATELRHGTTVATNTLLERSGARTLLVTTAGFGDVIEIGRQSRPDPYDHFVDRPPALVPRELRIEVAERVDHRGRVLVPLAADALPALVQTVACAAPEAVAVVLLHAYANPEHERRVVAALAAAGLDAVVASSDVAPEFREYERTSTTVMHAYLAPRTAGYLRRLDGDRRLPERVLVMRSAGGLGRAADLAGHPADALLSGPAAGALAAAAVARAAGHADALSFDMGGTSTDVCLVRDGRPEVRGLTEVGGLPCLAPALAVHTVGAGGGSIARLDAAGALRVGPESAGADPGPACYGRGGTEPTVTDANAALGRVRVLAGGALPLDIEAARGALDTLGAGAAEAVGEVVEANMERALRHVSVQQGVDPGELVLIAFGGAGGLHAAALCAAIGARAVLVPPAAGVLSAVGLLASPVRADRAHTDLHAVAEFSSGRFAALAADAAGEVAWAGDPVVTLAADCRYLGQSHEVRVPIDVTDTAADVADRFAAAHERLNGYVRDGAPVEVVTLRARAEVPSSWSAREVLASAASSVPPRLPQPVVPGPHLVEEADSCTWVPAGFLAREDALANLVLTPEAPA